MTSTQENLHLIGQLSVYGGKTSFAVRSQNGDLEFAGAMNWVMSLRQVHYLPIVLLNGCFYVTPIKDYSIILFLLCITNFLVSSVSPTTLATHMTAWVTTQPTQISVDVDSYST